MRQKLFFCSVIMFVMFNLMALNEFEVIFITINPSATSVSFGNQSGTADIWNRNPLDVWSNPAKLGYHKGISFGYSNDKWFDDVPGIDDITIKSSYVSYGWNGIGIMVPMMNSFVNFGTTLDYGEQEQTNENGEDLGTFNSFESCSEFAVGINILEFIEYKNKGNLPDDLSAFRGIAELSLGYNYSYIYSDLEPTYIVESHKTNYQIGKSHFHGFGMIQSFSPLYGSDIKQIKLGFTVGVYWLNYTRTNISHIKARLADPVPYGTRTAISGKVSVDMAEYLKIMNLNSDTIESITSFSKKLFSFYASYDREKLGNNAHDFGYGYEVAFFDIISLRQGKYTDKDGRIEGNTKGYGINLRYKDIVHLQYNYVEFPGGELQAVQDKSDFMINLNLIN
ncbi:MAG: hypothetical protein K8S56_06270 [Candidatus Cloacimonetes bacterium]|nr:hypothetical protein [Candidatus Cloacimonadota bacterium]